MHIVVGILALALIGALLTEFFIVFLLPRRVKRDPAIARAFLRTFWLPWRAVADRLPRASSDTMLGVFGPFGLLAILGVLSLGMVLGYCALQWAVSDHLGSRHAASFGEDLYFSAGAFFSASTPGAPSASLGKILQVLEAATGFSFLAIAIGYLPALFQAFSRRETAVSRLDARAGSPPTAASLLERSGRRGGWPELDAYLREWETWTAELMETHLSYPILGYFRSQHVNQNWLAALTTVVDGCAYAIAFGPREAIEGAELTFKIGRHALADLSHTFSGRVPRSVSRRTPPDRLPEAELRELRARLEGSGLHSDAGSEAEEKLARLRESYEPYAHDIAGRLALELPGWLPAGEVEGYWRVALQGGRAH